MAETLDNLDTLGTIETSDFEIGLSPEAVLSLGDLAVDPNKIIRLDEEAADEDPDDKPLTKEELRRLRRGILSPAVEDIILDELQDEGYTPEEQRRVDEERRKQQEIARKGLVRSERDSDDPYNPFAFPLREKENIFKRVFKKFKK